MLLTKYLDNSYKVFTIFLDFQAVGAQIYFDSYDKTDYKYTNEENVEVPITNRDALQVYDPDLVDLLDEVFPCNNKFVHRCTWKGNYIHKFVRMYTKKCKKVQNMGVKRLLVIF